MIIDAYIVELSSGELTCSHCGDRISKCADCKKEFSGIFNDIYCDLKNFENHYCDDCFSRKSKQEVKE
jgi:DNA-directed RNA polymerase subunit RPC12/RpoP